MSTSMIPFESAQLPAHLQLLNTGNDLASGGGFPIISIKGKVFHIKRGGKSELITKPDTPDEPAASIEVVILKAYPEGGKTAKTYYAGGYAEGSDDSPTCYSNDGEFPAMDVEDKQSDKCATCPQNVWGSKISESEKKLKACADVKRLAVAQPGALGDAMLIRVPGGSLKALTAYGDTLEKRKVPYPAVVTKIGFDYSVAHPALTFKPIGFVSEDQMAEIAQVRTTSLVAQITGQMAMPRDNPAPAPAKPAAAVTPAKRTTKKAETKSAGAEDLPTEKRAEVKVAETVKPAAAAKPAAKPEVVEADQGLDDALSGIEFDD